MAGLDISAVQDEILAKMESDLPYEVMEGDVTDGLTLVQINGVTQTFIVVQFGDLLHASGSDSFGGVTLDGYYSLVRTLAIGSSPKRARQAASITGQVLLGWAPDNATPLAKEWGGGSYTIGEANSRPLAYSALSSFRYETNIVDVSATVYP
jgi:hypothetical protein